MHVNVNMINYTELHYVFVWQSSSEAHYTGSYKCRTIKNMYRKKYQACINCTLVISYNFNINNVYFNSYSCGILMYLISYFSK